MHEETPNIIDVQQMQTKPQQEITSYLLEWLLRWLEAQESGQ